jgi:uncharacterized HAD superfamily protein
MKKILLDLDGVLYDWHYVVHREVNPDMDFNHFWTVFVHNQSTEYQDYICSIPMYYYGISPSKDVKDFLTWANNIFDIYYVTSRPTSVMRVTEKYFRDFNFPQGDNLIFESDKATLARLYSIDFSVEDSVYQIKNLSKVTHAFMYNRPWNTHMSNAYNTVYSMLELRQNLEKEL